MISSVTSAAPTQASAQMKQATGMNKDDFLRLFVTQLQHQDPMNPQDSTQFISQLAQLTQVEQAYNTNSNLQNLLNVGNAALSATAFSLLGRQVDADSSKISFGSGASEIRFRVDSAVSQATATVYDVAGNAIANLTSGALASGEHSLSWDGSTLSGTTATPGEYRVEVHAVNSAGDSLPATTFVRGSVSRVDAAGSDPTILVDGVELQLSDINSVSV